MLLIESSPGGLRISRWNGTDPRPLESIFVAEDELAALLADLLALANGEDAGLDTFEAGWNLAAALMGNSNA